MLGTLLVATATGIVIVSLAAHALRLGRSRGLDATASLERTARLASTMLLDRSAR